MAVQQVKLSISPKKDAQGTIMVLNEIMKESGVTWHDCRRKAYNIYACKLPPNYVYANKLEQPESYNAIMKRFKKPIVPVSAVEKVPGAVDFLKEHGCYVTEAKKITLCGTQGEMWDVDLEKIVSAYTLADGSPVNLDKIVTGKWFVVSRAGVSSTTEIGLQIPYKYCITVDMGWSFLCMNNPTSGGHCKGDIIVYPKGPDGKPDFNRSCSVINNAVFALTFDQTTGGWGRSGNILPADKAQENYPSLEYLNKVTASMTGGTAFRPVNPIPNEILESLYIERGECLGYVVNTKTFLNEFQSSNQDDDSNNLAKYKSVIEKAMLNEIYMANPSKQREICKVDSNFYRDYIGALATENAGWTSNLATFISSSAVVYAVMKYMQTKGMLGMIRSAHILGMFSFNLFSLYAIPKSSFEVDNRIYYTTDIELSIVGCSTKSSAKDEYGQYFVSLIIDKNKSEVLLAFVPNPLDKNKTIQDFKGLFDAAAVPVSNGGESFSSVLEKFANAIINAKRIWGKYIKPSDSSLDCMVYRTVATYIKGYYAHLLSSRSMNELKSVIYNYDDKDYPNGFTVSLTFNSILEEDKNAPKLDTEGNTRQLRVKFDKEKATLAFKIQFEGTTFDKAYKLTVKNNVVNVVLRAYMNMCNVLHVHPGKLFFSSSKVWNGFLLPQVFNLLRTEMPSVPVLKCKDIKTKDFFVYVNLGIYSADGTKEIGTRVLRVELNYKNFDVNNSSNANVAKEFDDTSVFEAMSIKIALQNMKAHRPNAEEFTNIQEVPFVIAFELKFMLEELISGTKKYAELAGSAVK